MPVFPLPKFSYAYDPAAEIQYLRAWKKKREVPAKSAQTLLLATWNIANFGAQDRRESDCRLIAEIISWFDLVAVQECREDLRSLRLVLAYLPKTWRTLLSDAAGNDERMVYLYNGAKVAVREQVGEVALPPSVLKNVKLPNVAALFAGFDRNPYLASFAARGAAFTLANVHLFYGSEQTADLQRRQLETHALSRWARGQYTSKTAYDPNVVLLGDFNLPFMQPDDPILSILLKNGLVLTEHSTSVGATLPGSDSATAQPVYQYDQIAFFPKNSGLFTGRSGVFDYDGAIFPDLWQQRGRKDFNAYLRYYLSDHRPLWAELKRGAG